jgi:maleylacetoacetate isomerase/maleylpyruvate isomerase
LATLAKRQYGNTRDAPAWIFPPSAAYRVRIALALKGIAVESVPASAERRAAEPRIPPAESPGLVPVLQAEAGVITQSLAIIEWLEETHPEPPLLPRDPYLRPGRGACFGHRLRCPSSGQSGVIKKLRTISAPMKAQTNAWYRHWVELGLARPRGDGGADGAAERGVCWHGAEPRRFAWCPRCSTPGASPATSPPCRAWSRSMRRLNRRPEFQAAAPERQADFQAS